MPKEEAERIAASRPPYLSISIGVRGGRSAELLGEAAVAVEKVADALRDRYESGFELAKRG